MGTEDGVNARSRQIESLAESSLKTLFENTEKLATEFDVFLKNVHRRVDQLGDTSLKASQYWHQQSEIACEKAKEEEERLNATITHCRELREEFQELKELEGMMYAYALLC